MNHFFNQAPLPDTAGPNRGTEGPPSSGSIAGLLGGGRRTGVVIGANFGPALVTANRLARYWPRVVLAVRDPEAGNGRRRDPTVQPAADFEVRELNSVALCSVRHL